MSTAKKILVGLLLIGLTLTTFAGISFAADKSGTNNPTSGFIAGCRGFFGGTAAELSKILGLNPNQIVEERRAGKSLADIAKDQGVSQNTVVNAIIEARKKILDERVKSGVITQDQENAILERMKANITAGVQNSTICPGAAGGGCGCYGGGPGVRWGRGSVFRGNLPATPNTTVPNMPIPNTPTGNI